MKNLILVVILATFSISSFGQSLLKSPTSGVNSDEKVEIFLNQRKSKKAKTLAFDPSLKPFYHGVASGDPLSDRVIIWTRVTPDSANVTINGTWLVSSDTTMSDTVASGTFRTTSAKDYTVKIDVTGLQSNTVYYYMFTAMEAHSLVGKTRTAPTGTEADHLKFGVVSCSNYEAGYFNAYRKIANRNDLDAVIHLGDYIYEYETGAYGDSVLSASGARAHDTVETVQLGEYRTRYSLYRLDPDLRSAHQQHAFINIWDDHESANDSWVNGAENHDSTEGSWSTRVNVSKQAFFEWIPIRDDASNDIYRTLNYGNLVDLIMLDTRLEGRDEQIFDVTNLALYAPTRTLLGSSQKSWFLNALDNSTAKWKVIGNQVIFSEFHVGWAAASPQTPADVESIFLDIWDGYPAERLTIINHLENNNLDNVVFLTGDFHSTFAFDVADSVTDPNTFYSPTANYDPATGNGSVAVEFTTPSITSANFDENLDPITSAGIEYQMNNSLPSPFPTANVPNPHMKYVDLDQHGYFILDLTEDSAQANWYFMDRIDTISSVENFGQAWYSKDGDNHLSAASAESTPKSNQDIPAPDAPKVYDVSITEYPSVFALMGVYPNPTNGEFTVQFALNQTEEVSIQIIDAYGKVVRTLADAKYPVGVFNMTYNPENLAKGIYTLHFTVGSQQFSRKLILSN